jgi:hypothetical protein
MLSDRGAGKFGRLRFLSEIKYGWVCSNQFQNFDSVRKFDAFEVRQSQLVPNLISVVLCI